MNEFLFFFSICKTNFTWTTKKLDQRTKRNQNTPKNVYTPAVPSLFNLSESVENDKMLLIDLLFAILIGTELFNVLLLIRPTSQSVPDNRHSTQRSDIGPIHALYRTPLDTNTHAANTCAWIFMIKKQSTNHDYCMTFASAQYTMYNFKHILVNFN